MQDGSVISVKSYTSDSVLNQSEDIKALITYAEVMKGSFPVINATVRATVERPGGIAVTYDLLDNGAGEVTIFVPLRTSMSSKKKGT